MPQTTKRTVHFRARLQPEPNILYRACSLFLPPVSWGRLTQCGAVLLASWLLLTGLYCTASICGVTVEGAKGYTGPCMCVQKGILYFSPLYPHKIDSLAEPEDCWFFIYTEWVLGLHAPTLGPLKTKCSHAWILWKFWGFELKSVCLHSKLSFPLSHLLSMHLSVFLERLLTCLQEALSLQERTLDLGISRTGSFLCLFWLPWAYQL